MKENLEFNKLDLEGLKKKEKSLNLTFRILIGMIAIMVLAGIYLTIKQGFNVFTILPVAFLPIVLTNLKNIKKIKEMVAEREVK